MYKLAPRVGTSPACCENLERRSLLSVSLDAAGYTLVTPGAGDRVIYVSQSAGADGADGLSADRPVQSLARGFSLLRDGRGDQLLLRRGDTWSEPLPGWSKSGASSERPMLLGAYGTGERPVIATAGSSAFHTAGSISHLVLQGIRFTAATRDPASPRFDAAVATGKVGVGVAFGGGGSDLLVEDCYVDHYATNLAVQGGTTSDVRLRRNVIADAWSRAGHAQGLFVDRVRGLLLEENVIDHNGWLPSASAGATIFNHNAYITTDVTGVVVRGNLFSNAASHGLQARSGGDIFDNLFVANPLHLSYGLVRGDGSPTPGGVSGVVNGNVFLGTRDIAGQVRGVGIQVANTRPGGPTLISNNIFSNVPGNGVTWQRGGFAAISLEVGSGVNDATLAAGLNDLTLQGNIIRGWAQGLTMQQGLSPAADGTYGYRRLTVKRNEFSGIESGPVVDHPAAFDPASERWSDNRYSGVGGVRLAGRSVAPEKWAGGHGDQSGVPEYKDAGRSLQAYVAGDATAYFAAARAMSRAAGTSAVSIGRGQTSTDEAAATGPAAGAIAFVRAGYDSPVAGAAPRNWKPPTPPAAEATLPASVTTDETGLLVTVTYRDDSELDLSTVDDGDVVLVSRGRRLPATLRSVTPLDGQSATATYHVASPQAVWRSSDRGPIKLLMVEGQVRDTDGFAVEPGALASGALEVVALPPPPKVQKLRFIAGKKGLPDRVVAKVSTDLAALPTGSELQLVAVPPATVSTDPPPSPADLSAAVVTFDSQRREVTWTLPAGDAALGGATLAEGFYTVTLTADTLRSVDAKPLDGNADGLGGDAYTRPKPIRVKR